MLSTSATLKKRYEVFGSPCLQPCSIVIGSERNPDCCTLEVILRLKILIQSISESSKPNSCNAFYKNCHDVDSKAFSKSIAIKRPGILFFSEQYSRSYIYFVLSLIDLPFKKPVCVLEMILSECGFKPFCND